MMTGLLNLLIKCSGNHTCNRCCFAIYLVCNINVCYAWVPGLATGSPGRTFILGEIWSSLLSQEPCRQKMVLTY